MTEIVSSITKDHIFFEGKILTNRLEVKKNGMSNNASQMNAAMAVPTSNFLGVLKIDMLSCQSVD
jgi:hypothetical protein